MSSVEEILRLLTEQSFLNISLMSYAKALMVLGGTYVVRALIYPVLSLISHSEGKQKTRFKSIVIDSIIPPVRLLVWVFGTYIALEILDLNHFASFDRLLRSFVLYSLFWGIYRVMTHTDYILEVVGINLDISVREWFYYGLKFIVVASGVAMILQTWEVPVAPLIGSLGVLGVGVGLAARDLFGNLISGILIMTEKRMSPGEWIHVKGVVNGTVEKINFRSTRIRLFNLSPVYVPNSLLADNAMINYSRMTYRRIYWTIGLEYGTAPDKLSKIRQEVENWLLASEDICDPSEATLFVRIDDFGQSSINLMIYCFTKTTVWGDWLKIKEQFALDLIPIVQNAGSGFAFPSRSLYIHTQNPPEVFDPYHPLKDN